jgi:hypothetical protein
LTGRGEGRNFKKPQLAYAYQFYLGKLEAQFLVLQMEEFIWQITQQKLSLL